MHKDTLMIPAPGMTDPATLPDRLPLHGDVHQGHAAMYLLPRHARLALRLAWVRARPLLVVGEAGVGKSQLAAAVAKTWGVPLFRHVIQSGTQADDLIYQFDAVRRLADAQVLAATFKGDMRRVDEFVRKKLDIAKYLQHGVLWRAWQAPTLHQQRLLPPELIPAGWQPQMGSVVLLDEIDKAPPDLPNNLLDVLDSGGFTLPLNGQRVEPGAGQPAPLIVITCNGDRPLPAPFLRRCVQLNLAFGEVGVSDADWLVQRGQAHLGKALDDAVLQAAAQQILQDRAARIDSPHRPGVSEYLDLIYAVQKLAADTDARMALLKELGQFMLKSGTVPVATQAN